MNIFEDSLNYGQVAESFFCQLVNAKYPGMNIYKANMQQQRNGIDFIINHISIDVKMRANTYGYKKDFLLETISVDTTKKPGWLHSSKSDVIAYMFKNKPTFFYLYLDNIRNSNILKNIDLFQKKSSQNLEYNTISAVVPIECFDANCIEEVEIINFKLPDIKKTNYKPINFDACRVKKQY